MTYQVILDYALGTLSLVLKLISIVSSYLFKIGGTNYVDKVDKFAPIYF